MDSFKHIAEHFTGTNGMELCRIEQWGHLPLPLPMSLSPPPEEKQESYENE
jgi:hypothetical protein